ncbi:Acetyltransferase (GNAT) family protein [Pseudorhodobacter antarcticus]|jgi:GNAT superfamily N-acetyltransferase|uniref:Acetyltransferase (GNAT) family protein n=1 Tax=Pseudorhodobacter antarcticus TaxID=1077947 RepID=A0A1H8D012_9RHOB|nr:GNAT family N-acetyltransferase [Pseudorhodobacter antarcticus]SEN00562.1 Acetyltransferase (GNAT) family protein [Pseudorhodobacter antarcticus]
MTQNHILTTRFLTAGDFDAWFPLWAGYLAQNNTKMRWQDRTALFAKLSGGAKRVAAMVVECDGKMVGFAHYEMRRAKFAFENAYVIQDLYVMPAYQAQRAGTHLVQAIYQASHDNGVPIIYWMAAENLHRRDAQATSPFLQFRKAA